jgi:hypothetical protein
MRVHPQEATISVDLGDANPRTVEGWGQTLTLVHRSQFADEFRAGQVDGVRFSRLRQASWHPGDNSFGTHGASSSRYKRCATAKKRKAILPGPKGATIRYGQPVRLRKVPMQSGGEAGKNEARQRVKRAS